MLQLRGELWKLFARKRTYLGFGVFLGVEILVLVMCQAPFGQRGLRHAIERMGGLFDQYFSGLTLAMIMVPITMILRARCFCRWSGATLWQRRSKTGRSG